MYSVLFVALASKRIETLASREKIYAIIYLSLFGQRIPPSLYLLSNFEQKRKMGRCVNQVSRMSVIAIARARRDARNHRRHAVSKCNAAERAAIDYIVTASNWRYSLASRENIFSRWRMRGRRFRAALCKLNLSSLISALNRSLVIDRSQIRQFGFSPREKSAASRVRSEITPVSIRCIKHGGTVSQAHSIRCWGLFGDYSQIFRFRVPMRGADQS